MSINSPAKQERIERHLMRQRGTGARIVTASFGFFFGNSAPTSADATPTTEAPLTKRRKTNLDVLTTVRESEVNVVKRRRLNFEEEDSKSTGTTSKHGDDDSFVEGLGRAAKNQVPAERQVKAKAAKNDDNHDENTIKRPRRRAAVSAKARAKDGLVEDAMPISKKRGATASKKQVGDAELRNGADTGSALEGTHETTLIPPVNQEPSRKGQRSAAKRAPRKADPSASGTDKEALPTVKTEIKSTNEPPQETAKPTKSRNRQQEGQHSDHVYADSDIENAKVFDQDQDSNVPARMKHSTARPKPAVKKRHHPKSTKVPLGTGLPNSISTPEQKRQPLRQADTNATRHSLSPLKHVGNDGTIKENAAKVLQPTEQSAFPVQAPAKNTRPQKQPQKDVATLRPTERKAVEKKTISHPQDMSRIAAEELPGKDEDIDWLFQPATAPCAAPKESEPKRRKKINTGSRTKMADIDLDDLLSNIASLAKTTGQTDAGNGNPIASRPVKAKRRK